MQIVTCGPARVRLRPAASKPGVSRLHATSNAIPLLIVSAHERRRLASYASLAGRLVFYDRADALRQHLELEHASAVVVEPHDCDGLPVAASLRSWVERRPLVPVIVWAKAQDSTIREVLDLAIAGADVRLILREQDELALVLERLFENALLPYQGAVPAILRYIVKDAPVAVQTDLTVGAYHAWPRPSVDRWTESLGIPRQALNTRLADAGLAPAGVIIDSFNAAEIAIRCTRGMTLKQIAIQMGRLDDRALRRRLGRLRCEADELRGDRDFAALLPRLAELLRRASVSRECRSLS